MSGDQESSRLVLFTSQLRSFWRTADRWEENTHSEDPMSDKFEMSGDFRGAIINIKSTLSNVQQSIGGIQTTDEGAREELMALIGQLSEALQSAPPEATEQAEAVAQTAEVFVQQATVETPNKTMLQITGDGLKQAAQNIAAVLPSVLGIATQIVMAVGKMTTPAG
jgi:hypothetical protein